MRLHAKPFALIESGAKTVELRLHDEKRAKIKLGDKISFTSRETDESIDAEVEQLHHAEAFDALIDKVGLDKLGVEDKEELLAELELYYPPMMQKNTGVVGIEFKKRSFIQAKELREFVNELNLQSQSAVAELRNFKSQCWQTKSEKYEETINVLNSILQKLFALHHRCEEFTPLDDYMGNIVTVQQGVICDLVIEKNDFWEKNSDYQYIEED